DASNNAGNGMHIDNNAATMGNVDISGTFDSNTSDGIRMTNSNTSVMGNIGLSSVDASNNSGYGMHIINDHSVIDNITITNATFNQNGICGTMIENNNLASMGNINLSSVTASHNGDDGFHVVNSQSNLINISIANAIFDHNVANGLLIENNFAVT